MTVLAPADYGIPLRPDGHPDFEGAHYPVYNPDRTIGISVDHSGSPVALHLDESTRGLTETALQAAILDLARIAAVRASYANRQRAEYWFAVRGDYFDPAYVSHYASRYDYEQVRRDCYPEERG
ncbi:hypothetical protein [Tsukamurella pseudospumae]|uniref:Uncharacterized protein n=1 Tax=Tsukamurella pseudospumae TaxID=239498 RepID=A0A137Z7Z8_9ACTN|nr:hypothetical protein [Tsukamurella pseudospumae]KXO94301.1 hypothetical protein AXK61_23790 [Tsukamurella pseudospumae]